MAEAVDTTGLHFRGKVQPQPLARSRDGQQLYPYLPDPALVEAVNLAIYLERPLLLKGEPGCGKTQLARAVAYELGLNLEPWYVKSTSRARDGLYIYDAVGRLRDAQLAASGRLSREEEQRFADPGAYIRWGPVGRAFLSEQRTVVLIDEIDKADIDFPNDLLVELDEQQFIVEEVRNADGDLRVRAKAAPIVFITSNDEKDLPDAFLRRCLFHYIEFPDHAQLVAIIKARFADVPDQLVQRAVERFLELREEMRGERLDNSKNMSTSELLDWFRVLLRYPHDQALARLDQKIPFLGVLLKSWESHVRYLKRG